MLNKILNLPSDIFFRMKKPKYIPEIRPVVFWDVPNGQPDFTKDTFVIPRVFNYGNYQEIADIIICYGKEYVKKLLLSSPDLELFGLAKASVIFGIPQKQFKCYTRIQYRWNSSTSPGS